MLHNHVNSIRLPHSQIVAAVFECFKSEAKTVCRFLKHYQFFVAELLIPQNVMDTAVANPRILTPSEIDVLQRLADGQPIKEIAGSRRRRNKVYQCLHRIRQKLDARHTLHAVAIAIRRGYISIKPNIATRQEEMAVIVCICSKSRCDDLEAALAELQRTGKILLPTRSLTRSLTRLEIETLQYLADGKTPEEVAQTTSKRRRSKEKGNKKLDWITQKRLQSIREKLDARHNAHAVRIAMELGLIR